MKNPRFVFGIDPGANTGFAILDRENGELILVTSFPHETAKQELDKYLQSEELAAYGIEVFVEDARQARVFFGKLSKQERDARKIGAGMVQQKCIDWNIWLASRGVNFHMVPPRKGGTKWKADKFKRATGYQLRTNEHGRDAAVLIWGR